ncbi:MAG: preprotein translocase subunit SecY [Candidatus Omnitrophica bacterium]|nr:preprotein translocase subunit SecY [Candidatus Omnitrophota bacterium]
MLGALVNAFKIPDLKKKILFTLGVVAIYRLGTYIPTPGINSHKLAEFLDMFTQTQGGAIFGVVNLFSGGAMERATIFALGIMPFITASIIMQLLTAVIPAFEKMAKEGGDQGRKQLTQYTRYATVGLSVVQSFFIALWLESPARFGGLQIVDYPGWGFRLLTILTLTSGSAFIMYLGELITERGVGNGASLLITAGIIAGLPTAGFQLWVLASPLSAARRQIQPITLVLLVIMMVLVVLAVVLITLGQRKISVQYAKRMVGRRMYGGQSTFIPLRVNQAGVIPIIFAQSLLVFPATIAGLVPNAGFQGLANIMLQNKAIYIPMYTLLILFFSYFYTAITFNPVDIADNIKKYGGFIPGIRPGRPTVDYLDFVMVRITLAGAVFLAFIAVFPDLIGQWMKIPYSIASFFGGTAMLIIVGVMLDTMRQIESHLLTRHYEGFMKRGRLKGRR